MFDAAYHDLEDCLNNYLLRKKSGGWSKAVMTFKRDKLGIIATKKNVSFLLNQAKAFSDTLYAPLYWMPCAAGSSLKDNLEAFMLKYEGSIPPQLPIDSILERRGSDPIPIPGATILNSYGAPSPSSSLKGPERRFSISLSGPIDMTPDMTPQTAESREPVEMQINFKKWIPAETKKSVGIRTF